MRNEAVFRVIFAAGAGVGTLVRLYYMRKVSESGLNISRKHEDRLRMALLVSCNVLGMIGSLMYVIVPQRLRWATLPLPT